MKRWSYCNRTWVMISIVYCHNCEKHKIKIWWTNNPFNFKLINHYFPFQWKYLVLCHMRCLVQLYTAFLLIFYSLSLNVSVSHYILAMQACKLLCGSLKLCCFFVSSLRVVLNSINCATDNAAWCLYGLLLYVLLPPRIIDSSSNSKLETKSFLHFSWNPSSNLS